MQFETGISYFFMYFLMYFTSSTFTISLCSKTLILPTTMIHFILNIYPAQLAVLLNIIVQSKFCKSAKKIIILTLVFTAAAGAVYRR